MSGQIQTRTLPLAQSASSAFEEKGCQVPFLAQLRDDHVPVDCTAFSSHAVELGRALFWGEKG